MILLGNKQNSLILLVFFSFSRMEIPVYNIGECTPWESYPQVPPSPTEMTGQKTQAEI